MNLNICINQINVCKGYVSEVDSADEYLQKGSNLTAKYRFEYKDTASVDIFKRNTTKGGVFTEYKITLRDAKDDKLPVIDLPNDGWYTAYHMVIPTEDWINREFSKEGSIIKVYDRVYYTDGNYISSYIPAKQKSERVTVDDLLNEVSSNTTISRATADYVSICHLQAAMDTAYKKILEQRMYNGSCHIDACEANRLTALINLVKHYVRWGQLAEAERIIEKINYSAVISTDTVDKLRTKGCGCGWT